MKQKLLYAVLSIFYACCITGFLSSCGNSSSINSSKDSLIAVGAMRSVILKVDSGLYDRARPFLDSVYRANGITSSQALSYKYEKLASIYYFQKSDTLTTLKYLDSMQALVKMGYKPEPDVMMSWYFFNGHVAMEGKRFDEAFRYYYRGKRIVDSLENGCGNIRYYNTLAMILFRQHKYDESKAYFRKCFEFAGLCNSNDTVAVVDAKRNSLSNIGICCENLAEYDSAVYYYDKCLDITSATEKLFAHKKLAMLKFKGVVYGNKGGALVKIGRYAEAEAALKQGIFLNHRPEGEMGDAILSMIKLADLYLITNRNKECRELIETLEKETKATPYLLADLRLASVKHSYYARIKNYEKAYKSQAAYLDFKKKIDANTNYNVLTSADHVKEFEALERRFELELLKSGNQLKNRYLLLSFAMMVMAVAIVVLLLIRRKASKSHIAKLTELNTMVQKSNAKLMKSFESLQHSQEENTRIMKVVAHDLRSPIAGIMTLVRMIKVDDLSKEELNEYIDLVEKSGNNALAFIEDLLYINNAIQELATKEADLEQLLESCVNIMQTQASRKNQTIHLDSKPVMVKVSEEKIWRVINNIISNAIKFSAIGTHIYVRSAIKDRSVVISVKDEGMGIPDVLKDKLFNMFSGAGRVGTSGEQSYGLGLSIARQIVEAHNGKIWFESDVNIGTTFFVELPLG